MAKKYYWLQLKENFFSQPKIKKLRRIAGGDTYTIIYLKLQLLSLKDEGNLYFEGIEDNFIDELALTIDEDAENIKVTVSYLIAQGLLEEVETDEFSLPEAKVAIGSQSESTQRVRRMREKRKQQKSVTCNGNVTKCNTELEIKKEKELDKDTDTNKEPTEIEKIYNEFSKICISLPKPRRLSDKRKKAIKTILKTYTYEDVIDVFQKTEESDWLTGRGGKWNANFDWIFITTNFLKILEENYKNKQSQGYQPNKHDYQGTMTEEEINEYDKRF